MDSSEGKRGFSGLADLATKTNEVANALPSLQDPIIASEKETIDRNDVIQKTSAPQSGKKMLWIIGIVVATVVAIYMFSSPASVPKQPAQSQDMSASRQNPESAVSPPIKKISAAEIISDISSVLSSMPTINPNKVHIKGKVLVWDKTSNRISSVQSDLPQNMKWTGSINETTTVMIISDFQNKQVGTYGTDIPAYKRTATLLIATWPDKKAVGRITIIGDDPPQQIRFKSRPKEIYGDINRPIAQWI